MGIRLCQDRGTNVVLNFLRLLNEIQQNWISSYQATKIKGLERDCFPQLGLDSAIRKIRKPQFQSQLNNVFRRTSHEKLV